MDLNVKIQWTNRGIQLLFFRRRRSLAFNLALRRPPFFRGATMVPPSIGEVDIDLSDGNETNPCIVCVNIRPEIAGGANRGRINLPKIVMTWWFDEPHRCRCLSLPKSTSSLPINLTKKCPPPPLTRNETMK